jgi:superoxide reductase
MELLQEKTADTGKEKHVPVVEQTESGILVKVGSVPHPMEPKHYIEWVELITDTGVYRKYLTPADRPQAEFPVRERAKIIAREHCNIHGLWRS